MSCVVNFLSMHVLTSMVFRSIHYSGADVTAHGYSDLNPFMVAIEKNHLEVAMTILEKNPDCLGSQSAAKIFNWALERKLTSFVQVCAMKHVCSIAAGCTILCYLLLLLLPLVLLNYFSSP